MIWAVRTDGKGAKRDKNTPWLGACWEGGGVEGEDEVMVCGDDTICLLVAGLSCQNDPESDTQSLRVGAGV